MLTEQRRDTRLAAEEMFGDITDGRVVLQGRILDYSPRGCRIVSPSNTFRAEKHTYSAVVSTGGKHFKILVIPRWSKWDEENSEFEMGFKIIDSTWDWIAFNELPH